MTGLNEKHHAFITASFFKVLKEEGLENYLQTFLFATRIYATQRGMRMALRAVRDGRPLNFASYRWYSEWAFTDDFLKTTTGEIVRQVEDGENYTVDIFACPWSRQYLEMDLPDGAEAYCSILDQSIVNGFNPDLRFEVGHTMHKCGDYCRQTQFCADIGKEEAYGPKKAGNVRDFNFHCGHAYTAYSETVSSVYGPVGEKVAAMVLVLFRKEFGSTAAEILLSSLQESYLII